MIDIIFKMTCAQCAFTVIATDRKFCESEAPYHKHFNSLTTQVLAGEYAEEATVNLQIGVVQ